MEKARLFSFIMAAIAIILTLFITQGIPISHTNLTGHLSGNTGRTSNVEYLIAMVNVFNPNVGMFDRPVRDITQRLRFYIFGLSGFWYHFISALILGMLIFFIVIFCYYIFGSYFVGIFASSYYLFSPPIWHQIPTLEENSVLTELFVALAFFIFLKGYYSLKGKDSKDMDSSGFVRNCISVFIFSWLAVKTKGSAKIIFPVILIFILLTDRRLVKRYAWLLLGIFIVSFPVIGQFLRLFFPQASQADPIAGLDIKKIYKLIIFNPDYSPSFGASLLTSATPFIIILAIIGAIVFFLEKISPHKRNEISGLLFMSLWFLGYSALYIGYPVESEPRYLVSCLVPFSMSVSFFISKTVLFFNDNKRRSALLVAIAFISIAFCMNAYKIYQLRSAHWSYWIAQDNVRHLIEKEEKAGDALVIGDVELETISQLNSTNTYVSRFITAEELNKALKGHKDVYVVKHFQPFDTRVYGHDFVLVKVVTGSGKTYFDAARNYLASLLARFKRSSVGHQYYVYKMTR